MIKPEKLTLEQKKDREAKDRFFSAYKRGEDPKRFLLDKDIDFLRAGKGDVGENHYSFLKLHSCGLITDDKLLLDNRVRWHRTDLGDAYLAERGLLDQPETAEAPS